MTRITTNWPLKLLELDALILLSGILLADALFISSLVLLGIGTIVFLVNQTIIQEERRGEK